MFNATANMSTFRVSEIIGCSTPIRVFNDTSSENGSSSSSTYRDCSTGVRIQYSELEPLDISDESSDETAPQEVNVVAQSNVDGVVFRSGLQVVLHPMTHDYIRDMMNGVKSTQSARTEITQTERPQTRSDKLQKNDRKRDASKIDHKSWQWQPILRLDRIDENGQNSNQSEMSTSNVPPIEFDRDESIIRELSPEKATEIFERRLEVIKKTMQPISMKPRNPKAKRATRATKKANELQTQYEEVHKRLQEKTKKRPKNAKKGRKLYNPSDSYEESAEKENDEPDDMEPKSKRPRISSAQPVRILPNRAAKNIAK